MLLRGRVGNNWLRAVSDAGMSCKGSTEQSAKFPWES